MGFDARASTANRPLGFLTVDPARAGIGVGLPAKRRGLSPFRAFSELRERQVFQVFSFSFLILASQNSQAAALRVNPFTEAQRRVARPKIKPPLSCPINHDRRFATHDAQQ
jgi:hypothetical protein